MIGREPTSQIPKRPRRLPAVAAPLPVTRLRRTSHGPREHRRLQGFRAFHVPTRARAPQAEVSWRDHPRATRSEASQVRQGAAGRAVAGRRAGRGARMPA